MNGWTYTVLYIFDSNNDMGTTYSCKNRLKDWHDDTHVFFLPTKFKTRYSNKVDDIPKHIYKYIQIITTCREECIKSSKNWTRMK